MSALTNFLENELLDHTLGVASYTAPSTVYLSLYTSNPTDADTGTEIYQRLGRLKAVGLIQSGNFNHFFKDG